MSQPTWNRGLNASRNPQSVNKIQQRVTQLLRELNLTEPPIEPEQVAKALGLRVIAEPFDGEISGALLQTEEATLIGVNSKHPKTRQHFSIAHEIGHFILHKMKGPHFDRKILLRGPKSSLAVDPLEIEANRFAAELLMPKALIMADLEALGIDALDEKAIKKLAARYKVSVEALTVRLSSLGLLTI
jgi:Zn-dependent peptidase ImmA (M78 family)